MRVLCKFKLLDSIVFLSSEKIRAKKVIQLSGYPKITMAANILMMQTYSQLKRVGTSTSKQPLQGES